MNKYRQSFEKKIFKVNQHLRLPTFNKEKTTTRFSLDSLTSNRQLMENQRFTTLLNNLKLYNKKLDTDGQTRITNYKLYEFLYTSLLLCKTKLNSEIDDYLRLIEKEFERFHAKREIVISKKTKALGDDEEQIRKTFKSNLPLEINEFRRRNIKKEFFRNDQITIQDPKIIKLTDQTNLSSQRIYHIQLREMLKKQEERQRELFLRLKRKNHSKMLSLTCNNFYKSMWNKKDILKDKTNIEEKNETFFQTGLNYEKKKKRILPNELNFRSSVRKSETNKNPFFDFSNVDGIGLLKNPFEPNRKAKKEKI